MPSGSGYYKGFTFLVLIGPLVLPQIVVGQGNTTLLRLQRLNAELETDENRQSMGRNIWEAAAKGDPQDVQKYPNYASLLGVKEDGKYFFEKRDGHTVTKPKVKSAEGVLTADELQRLKAILED